MPKYIVTKKDIEFAEKNVEIEARGFVVNTNGDLIFKNSNGSEKSAFASGIWKFVEEVKE